MSSRTYTVGQLVAEGRLLCDWQNLDGDYSDQGSYMSSGTLVAFLNRGYQASWNAYVTADEGFANERYTVLTAVGTSLYDLPDDLKTLRAVQVASDDGTATTTSGWVPLRKATVDDDRWTGQSAPVGTAIAYRELGDQLELVPTPGDVRTLRLTYLPYAQMLSSSLQTVDDVDGIAMCAVLRMGILGRIREEKPFADLQMQLDDYERQFREQAKRRDRATPHYTRDRRGAWSSWPRRYGGR